MKNYRHIYRERKSLVSCESHLMQYVHHRDIFGSVHNNSFLFSYNGIGEELHLDGDYGKWFKLGKKLFNAVFFKKLLDDGRSIRKDLELLIENLNEKDLSKLTDHQLSQLFLGAYKIYSRVRGYFKTSRPEFQSYAENRLKKLLLDKLNNPDKVQETFELMIVPQEFDEIGMEAIDWEKLVSGKNINEEILLKHVNKYAWVAAETYNRPHIITNLTNKYKEDKKNLAALKNKIKILITTRKTLISKQKNLLRQFKNKEINYLSWVFKEASLERMRLKGCWVGADFLYFPLYKEISNRSGISLKDLYSFYRRDEILQGIKKHQKIVLKTEIKRRKSAYLLWLKKGKIYFYSGRAAKKIIEKELNHMKKKTGATNLRGQVASLGHATGKVRIVISGDIYMLDKALKSFKKGEILVSPMTQPNMVPLMAKAAAIVTDQGGLVSHAAIIAREFKIPCIVGTEISTKIFKNGDLVEVDAYKGIVRKLK